MALPALEEDSKEDQEDESSPQKKPQPELGESTKSSINDDQRQLLLTNIQRIQKTMECVEKESTEPMLDESGSNDVSAMGRYGNQDVSKNGTEDTARSRVTFSATDSMAQSPSSVSTALSPTSTRSNTAARRSADDESGEKESEDGPRGANIRKEL